MTSNEKVEIRINLNVFLKKTGIKTIAELSELSGVKESTIYSYLTGRYAARNSISKKWNINCLKMCHAINATPEEIFMNSIEVNDDSIADLADAHAINECTDPEDPFAAASHKEEREILQDVIRTLSEREQHVLALRYLKELTIKQSSEVLKLSKQRIRQIEAKALRKLGHPDRAKKLGRIKI